MLEKVRSDTAYGQRIDFIRYQSILTGFLRGDTFVLKEPGLHQRLDLPGVSSLRNIAVTSRPVPLCGGLRCYLT
jgi:hypothetical protein